MYVNIVYDIWVKYILLKNNICLFVSASISKPTTVVQHSKLTKNPKIYKVRKHRKLWITSKKTYTHKKNNIKDVGTKCWLCCAWNVHSKWRLNNQVWKWLCWDLWKIHENWWKIHKMTIFHRCILMSAQSFHIHGCADAKKDFSKIDQKNSCNLYKKCDCANTKITICTKNQKLYSILNECAQKSDSDSIPIQILL